MTPTIAMMASGERVMFGRVFFELRMGEWAWARRAGDKRDAFAPG